MVDGLAVGRSGGFTWVGFADSAILVFVAFCSSRLSDFAGGLVAIAPL
jgi:hypothetical protein